MKCPYCGGVPELVGGARIYPYLRGLWGKNFYLCTPCNAYVGCHTGTSKALGGLANAELREARGKAHAAFDPLWRSGRKTRSAAYSWLSRKLGIEKELCHIGMFDLATCRRVVALFEEGNL